MSIILFLQKNVTQTIERYRLQCILAEQERGHLMQAFALRSSSFQLPRYWNEVIRNNRYNSRKRTPLYRYQVLTQESSYWAYMSRKRWQRLAAGAFCIAFLHVRRAWPWPLSQTLHMSFIGRLLISARTPGNIHVLPVA